MSDPPDRVGSGITVQSGPGGGEPGQCAPRWSRRPPPRRWAMLEAALGMQQRVLRFLAAQDAAGLPAPAVADQLRALERADAVGVRPPGAAAGGLRFPGRAPGRRAAQHPGLAGPLAAGDQGPGRRAPGGPGAGPQPPRAARGPGRGLGAHHVRGPAAGPVDQGDPGGVPGQGRGHPGRRGPGRRGPARPGRDLRGDPGPHRRARPRRRQRQAPGPRAVAGHDIRRRRSRPR